VQWRGDFVLEELSDAAVSGIDAAQKLALVKTQADGVIGLARSGWPCRSLTGEHDRQAIEVRDDGTIDGLVDREQAGLMREELADRDLILALLCELRPVRATRSS
jgi:hypothetical protein